MVILFRIADHKRSIAMIECDKLERQSKETKIRVGTERDTATERPWR